MDQDQAIGRHVDGVGVAPADPSGALGRSFKATAGTGKATDSGPPPSRLRHSVTTPLEVPPNPPRRRRPEGRWAPYTAQASGGREMVGVLRAIGQNLLEDSFHQESGKRVLAKNVNCLGQSACRPGHGQEERIALSAVRF